MKTKLPKYEIYLSPLNSKCCIYKDGIKVKNAKSITIQKNSDKGCVPTVTITEYASEVMVTVNDDIVDEE